jgi:hypothetical protein
MYKIRIEVEPRVCSSAEWPFNMEVNIHVNEEEMAAIVSIIRNRIKILECEK